MIIPTSFGQLTKLIYFFVSSNRFFWYDSCLNIQYFFINNEVGVNQIQVHIPLYIGITPSNIKAILLHFTII